MGSQMQEELTILVTGFGPFRTEYPVNPSWEIARSLPEYLPPLRAKDANLRSAPDIPPVRIVTPDDAIRVNYKVVRGLVPSFWEETYNGHKIDAVLHIGMAGPRPMYQIERRGHRRGYKAVDVDNELLEDDKEGMHGDDWIWHGLPDELETDLDIDGILERWQSLSSKDMDLRISEDAGHYLCDFIYYSSLSTLYKENKERKVLFLHVPSDASEWSVSQGRELAMNLIRSIVESQVAKKRASEASA